MSKGPLVCEVVEFLRVEGGVFPLNKPVFPSQILRIKIEKLKIIFKPNT